MTTLVRKLSDAMLERFVPKVTVKAATTLIDVYCGCEARRCLKKWKRCTPVCGACIYAYNRCDNPDDC